MLFCKRRDIIIKDMDKHKKRVFCGFPNKSLASIFFFVSALQIAVGQTTHSKPVFNFKGQYIVTVSDADMVASAYLDGHLGEQEGKDALSVIRLDKPVNQLKAIAVEVSNSVTGPPSSVAVSPDGHYAIVVETLGQRPIGKDNPLLSDLPVGKIITVLNLSDPDRPNITQQFNSAEHPLSVTFNSDGTLVAITYAPKDTSQCPLAIYRFSNGKLVNLNLPAIPGYANGDVINGAVFHPSNKTLVLLNATKSLLCFFTLIQSANQITLSKWGNFVLVDKEPFKACFTPNGRFLIVNAMYSASVRGSVTTIAIATQNPHDTIPTHQIVSRVLAGVLPEGLTMSPDARWIVTTNLEQSTQPFDKPEQGFFSSLTLIRLNAETGLLERIGDFAFDGILPESAVFDNTSQFLAVATFDHYDANRKGGSIDFWRLTSDYFDPTRIELVKTDYSVPVTRGVHSMVLIR